MNNRFTIWTYHTPGTGQSYICGSYRDSEDEFHNNIFGHDNLPAYLCEGVILDHDVPPDGETQGQPDGHRVDHQREVDVEQDHHAPTVAELKLGR